jgi:phosphate-selective porin OprO/OprP
MIKRTTVLALGMSAALGSINAPAADKELLDMLLQNGAITQSQYDKLLKKQTLTKRDVSDVTVKLGKKGLQFETADKQFKLKFGGRLHADASYHDGQDKLAKKATEGTEIRRARLYMKGVLWNDWHFMSEFDFADNSTAVKDLYLSYTGIDALEITVGHQKHAISMEVQESSNDIMFIERSLVYALTAPLFDRAIGLNLKSSGKNWSAQIGVYGDSMDSNKDAENDEGWGLGSRVTYTPIISKTQVLHLGAYGGYRAPSDSGNVLNTGKADGKFKLGYETTHMSNLYLTRADVNNVVDHAIIGGVDAAYMQGPFSIQGEYARLWLDRKGQSTLDFDAFYVQTGWTLTGESRSYKGSDGEFKRLKPAKPFSFSGSGWGAVELAARYDQVDLNSDDIQGGHEKAITVAVNWYLNENVRIMADWRRPFSVSGSPAADPAHPDGPEELDIFSLRTQWAF